MSSRKESNTNTASSTADWYISWNRKALLWTLLAFAAMMAIQFPFIFFFDTELTNVGFMYVYFWMLPQAIILYFLAFKLRVSWIFTFILGLTGIVGAPIDYYFEVVLQQDLIAPIFAFMYIPLFTIMGLSADISLMKLHPEKRPIRASVISSSILAATVLGTIAFAAFFSILFRSLHRPKKIMELLLI
jgi:hypothetical protein